MGQDNGRGRVTVTPEGTLVIRQVSVYDRGRYKCVASNAAGVDSVTMRLQVVAAPPNILEEKRQLLRANTGQGVWMPCTAQGDPQPTSHWVLFGGTVVRPPKTDSKVSVFPNGTLHMKNLDVSDSGKYECIATSSTGSERRVVTLSVKKIETAPQIVETSDWRTELEYGANIRFDCEAAGEPKPKILWRLPSNDMIAASNERYLMHVNGSLDVRDVKLADAGEYVCMARNAAGDESKVYKLDIDGNPPVINGYYQNRTVLKDTAAKYSRKMIDCKAEGKPPPKITWIMPGNIFLSAPYFGSRINVHYNGTLEIRNVRPTDTAEFICMAQNDGGEAVMVVQLEVTSQLMRPIFKNPFNERLLTQLGKTTVLNCSADGQPPPNILWTLPNGTQYQIGNDGTFNIKCLVLIILCGLPSCH
uniref:Ig-like domain-containing protein n=1 Tax=Electrophorus electricus TaxID=8005 RepID=A0A4W4HK68_ELEEL